MNEGEKERARHGGRNKEERGRARGEAGQVVYVCGWVRRGSEALVVELVMCVCARTRERERETVQAFVCLCFVHASAETLCSLEQRPNLGCSSARGCSLSSHRGSVVRMRSNRHTSTLL